MANSNNTVILKGHLGVAPKITELGNGNKVANIFILTNRPDYKDKNDVWHKREPQRNNVAVFIPSAIAMLEGLTTGAGIEVHASVEIREFSDKRTGEDRRAVEIVCNDRYAGHKVKDWTPARAKPKPEAA